MWRTASLRAMGHLRRGSLLRMRAHGPATQSAHHTSSRSQAEGDGNQRRSPVEGQLYGRADLEPAPSPFICLAKADVDPLDNSIGIMDVYPMDPSEDPSVDLEEILPSDTDQTLHLDEGNAIAAGQGWLTITKVIVEWTTQEDPEGPKST